MIQEEFAVDVQNYYAFVELIAAVAVCIVALKSSRKTKLVLVQSELDAIASDVKVLAAKHHVSGDDTGVTQTLRLAGSFEIVATRFGAARFLVMLVRRMYIGSSEVCSPAVSSGSEQFRKELLQKQMRMLHLVLNFYFNSATGRLLSWSVRSCGIAAKCAGVALNAYNAVFSDVRVSPREDGRRDSHGKLSSLRLTH